MLVSPFPHWFNTLPQYHALDAEVKKTRLRSSSRGVWFTSGFQLKLLKTQATKDPRQNMYVVGSSTKIAGKYHTAKKVFNTWLSPESGIDDMHRHRCSQILLTVDVQSAVNPTYQNIVELHPQPTIPQHEPEQNYSMKLCHCIL